MTSDPAIVVVGSLVIDIVVELPRLPRLHETLVASRSSRHLGGKGFNQALTAARLGARAALIGAAGNDDGLASFRAVLEKEAVDLHVFLDGDGTGLAFPMVLPDGSNAIVLLPRANSGLRAAHVTASRAVFRGASALLLQHEVPVEASLAAGRIARELGVTVVLNPAPARSDADELVGLADWLVPNEVEASALAARDVTDPDSAFAAAASLLPRVRSGVIVTLGAAGAVAIEKTGARHRVAPFRADVSDPTGAGDAFCAAFAVGLAEGMPVSAALRLASAAGAFAVGRVGAEPGLPRRADIDALLSAGRESDR
jgi:ribokinase